MIWWAYQFPMLARWQTAMKLISRRCSSAILQACVVLLVFSAVLITVNPLYFSTGISRNSGASLPTLVKFCFCCFWFYWKKRGENCFSVFSKKIKQKWVILFAYLSFIVATQWVTILKQDLYPKLQSFLSAYSKAFMAGVH